MKACVVHEMGGPAFGCLDCNAATVAKVEEAADDIYSRGFADGVKWVTAGLKISLNQTLRDLDRAVKRTARVSPQATTPKGGK